MAQTNKRNLSMFSILPFLQVGAAAEGSAVNAEAAGGEGAAATKTTSSHEIPTIPIPKHTSENEESEEDKRERHRWAKEDRESSRKEREKKQKEEKRKEKNESLITLLFFAGLIFHLWDVLTRLNFSVISLSSFNYIGYIVFAIVASIAYDEINLKSILRNLGVFTAMYLAPVLFQFIFFNIGLPLQMASSFVVLGLIFSIPLYFSLLRGNHKTQLIGTIYLTVLLLLMIGANIQYVEQITTEFSSELGIDAPGIPMGMTLKYIFKDIIFDGIYGWINLGIDSVVSLVTGQIQGAVAPFEGRVESGAKEKLGVYLDEVRTIGSRREGDEITATGKLYAKSIDTPVDVLINCIIDDESIIPGNQLEANNIYPKKVYKKIKDVEETVECSWSCKKADEEKNNCIKISAGAHDLLMRARVADFTTSAYLKGYFMNEETMRELRMKGVQPLESLKVSEREPIGVYTNGPVKVGMELSSKPLVSISPSEETKFSLLLSLEASWGGKITQISRLYIIVPKEIRLESFTGTDIEIFPATCDIITSEEQRTGCNSEQENVYEIPQEILQETQFDENKKAAAYRAKMSIPNSEINSFMGRQQLTQKYFKLITQYNFDVEKKQNFFVEAAPK